MICLYDVAAPAKLNLFLHITGRRDDGYHLLQSVFMLIDWCDTLNFELRQDGLISREDLGASLPADDLIVRAARALQAATGSRAGVHIGVYKRVPAQAGMGGGSSDAATTLLALNRLWQLNLPLRALSRIGLTLGADVPFFLGGHNAWVEGIGEQIRPIQLPTGRFLVVKPQAGLETRAIFSDPDLKRDTETAIISGFAANAFGFGRNDLQPVAQKLCPGVTQALEWLQSLGLSGRMTGSGSAVFAPVLQNFNLGPVPHGFQVRLCNSLAAHPLVGWATDDSFLVNRVSD
ncbi:MAG: hypothetical protein RLZ81_1072 [Pseudomonadota bacterium]|jgi:4-diphosphocytidyl-2-C-methyl-D-erythritol kinase